MRAGGAEEQVARGIVEHRGVGGHAEPPRSRADLLGPGPIEQIAGGPEGLEA
jgi:hypothetical protein